MGFVVGTAGHIDHGKSSLVMALTGQDPDRLEEEKRRGITIELGYVFMPLPDGSTLAFIDVPGHERFVRQMVAGVATVDMFLLVVSADEGVMPQTREHFEVLRLLEVDRGIVALTKTDLVDREMVELAAEDVRELLRGTPAEGAPIVPVSSLTGEGLEDIRRTLIELVGATTARQAAGSFRLPIDRVFTIKGHGTVVAGTALSGEVHRGETVELLPAGRSFRVRELHSNQGAEVDCGSAGERVALNLVGLERNQARRGDCLGTPGTLSAVWSLDASCRMLDWAGTDLGVRQRVRFHAGTAEVMARAIPIEGRPLRRGSEGYVHFQLEDPVVALPGDRFVIRRFSPVITVGGGVVLETNASKVRSRGRDRRVEHLSRLAEGDLEALLLERLDSDRLTILDAAELLEELPAESRGELEVCAERLASSGQIALIRDEGASRIISGAQLERLSRALLEGIGRYHREKPLSLGMPSARLGRVLPPDVPSWLARWLVASLSNSGELVRSEGRLSLRGHETDLERCAGAGGLERLMGRVLEAGFEGFRPSPGDEARLADAVLERGLLFALGDSLVSSPEVEENLRSLVERAFGSGGFRLGELRQAIGVSRRIALAWAERLDSKRITRREGDLRYLNEVE
ncbi:selenocysteine-specific translation elongation factor [Candidatus Fermentibacterales bacterium]|nr:selenocysteine-specific translation elongation factor [Candidatus Fermentibacterales bacterium]